MDEVLARVRSDRVFLLNLSGRDLPFAFRRDAPFSLYDPGTDAVVFTGCDLPAGTMLRAGAACLIVQPSFKAARAPLENSVFAPVARWEALACDAVTPTRPNAFVIPAGGHCEIDIPEGCTVDSAYGEGLSPDTIHDNGSALDASPAPHHPCDIAFGGLRLRRPWRGSHELSMPKRTDPVYLEGRFLVREDGTLASPPESLALGNLVPQGLPHYWGTLLYRFRFAGRARLLRISLDNGMAEVFVNGRRCGIVAGAPFILPINDATRDGQNFLLVRFSNQ